MVPVRPGYFRAVGAALRRGRDVDARDAAGAPAVAVVNETLARRFWPGEDAVGQRLVDPDEPDEPITVVGVVGDLRSRALDEDAGPEVYLPHAQAGWSGGSLYVTLRTAGDPAAAAPALRAAVWALDPALPVTEVGTLAALVSASAAAPRFRTLVVGALAAVAGALALVGIWGVLSYAVAQRTREIGVRMALGAAGDRVLREVVGRGLSLTLLGVALGLSGALAATRSLRTLLFGVGPLDPVAYGATVVALAAAALGACWLPARRAARVDPVTALRDG
jgi:putative ABC transport system permease protein